MTTPKGFSVSYRNYGHWDVCVERSRWFAIRGGPGSYFVRDERPDGPPHPREHAFTGKTLGACMAFVCDTLMYELIVAEGQEPQVIESWNVPATPKGGA